MKIVFKEDYLDKDAKNSDDGSKEMFTAGREYPVKESFGISMIKKRKAVSVSVNFKEKEED